MTKKILIVDDEPDIIDFQKAFLSRRKYEVLNAINVAEAMEKITRESPDIVFCDVRLDTDTAGLDILEQAKKSNPGIIVYLVTGLLEKDIEIRGLAAGAREILTKPVSNEVLEKKVIETG